jgi:hypothetical protein
LRRYQTPTLIPALIFAPIHGPGNIADRPVSVCLVTNR